ncbi:hypothetical protein ACKVM6_03595 [Pantoea agglomerans]|uniref:hypothetical protein n=1 Tax=Enterobacter agglomerans TaxID=549 RepID=UPI003909E67F
MNGYYLVKVYGLKHIYKHEPIYLIYDAFSNFIIKDFTSLVIAQEHLSYLNKTKVIYKIPKTYLINSFNNIKSCKLTSDNKQDIEIEAKFDSDNSKILVVKNESNKVSSLTLELYMQDKLKKDQQARSELEQDLLMQNNKNENKKRHN